MKFLVMTAMLLMGATATMAQTMTPEQMLMIQKYQNMSPEQMQQMMQGAQAAAACMGGVDMAKLQELQARGEAISSKIKTLCSAGNQTEAEAFARKEGMKLKNDPIIVKMQSCSQDMMKQFDFSSMVSADKTGGKGICE